MNIFLKIVFGPFYLLKKIKNAQLKAPFALKTPFKPAIYFIQTSFLLGFF
jgi:hypothetical protein